MLSEPTSGMGQHLSEVYANGSEEDEEEGHHDEIVADADIQDWLHNGRRCEASSRPFELAHTNEASLDGHAWHDRRDEFQVLIKEGVFNDSVDETASEEDEAANDRRQGWLREKGRDKHNVTEKCESVEP